jgi:hypothetical protein
MHPKTRERKVSCYCSELHLNFSIIKTIISSQQTMPTSSRSKVINKTINYIMNLGAASSSKAMSPVYQLIP